jgi:cell division protein FtsL
LDFLDVSSRAEKVAKQEVDKAGIKLQARQIWITLLALVVSAIVAGSVSWATGVYDVKARLDLLERSISISKVEQRIDGFDQRIKAIEEQSKASQDGAGRKPAASPTNQGAK